MRRYLRALDSGGTIEVFGLDDFERDGKSVLVLALRYRGREANLDDIEARLGRQRLRSAADGSACA